tara:strand:+ start:89 stop:607 length:519 start_codon:yes stop_codon:yes gene_type:complete
MERPTRSGKDQKKKRAKTFTEALNKLKIRKLSQVNKRGRVVSTKKKGLSNIPVKERSAPVNKKARGLSNLGSDYKKQEEKLSKKATKKSAQINKARYPKMGTFKNKDGKSVADEKKTTSSGTQERYGKAPKGYIKAGTSFVSLKTAKGKAALNKLKAKRRAQEAARKRLANK